MDSSLPNNPSTSPCDSTRRLVLDLGLSTSDLQQLSEALAHVRTCQECRAATTDFDHLRLLLGGSPEAERPPEVNWPEVNWIDRPDSRMRPRNRTIDFRSPVRIGLAACLALGFSVGGYFLGRQPSPAAHPAVSSVDPTGFTPISAADVSDRARAFTRVNQAFDNRAGWMLVSSSDSDVGLDTEPSAASGMLLLRLTVTRHKTTLDAGASPLEVVSSADLAILPGRNARISLPFSMDRVLSYEIEVGEGNPTHLGLTATLLPRTAASVGASITKPLAALSTSLDLRPGAMASAGSFATGAAGYDVTIGFATANLPNLQP